MQTRVLAEIMAVVQAVVHPMVAARVDIPADMLPLLLAWLSMLILGSGMIDQNLMDFQA